MSVKQSTLPDIAGIELFDEIGRGAHSVVYWGQRGEQIVAVKLQRTRGTDDAGARRFRRESTLLASLSHPAFPEVFEVGHIDGRAYTVMEYLDRPTLHSFFEQDRLALADHLEWAVQLASALDSVHQRGLAHRDIKPKNVLFVPGGQLHLIDFGLASSPLKGAADESVVGTLAYAAPEQIGFLNSPIDGRADLYAIGAMLFEALAGRPPFRADSLAELLEQHAAAPADELRSLRPELSPALSKIVAKLLAKDPDDRYQRAADLVADLERLDELDATLARGQPAKLGRQMQYVRIADRGPLVGRRAQQRVLRQRWQQARQGRGSFVLVEGEAGAGKSRLCGELLGPLTARGKMVFVGKASRDESRPLAALREGLDAVLRSLSFDVDEHADRTRQLIRRCAGASAYALERFSARLATILDVASVAEVRAPSEQQYYEAITEFLLRLADETGGMVIFLDDIQWLDEATLQVVRRLADRLDGSRLLILAAARTNRCESSRLEVLLDQIDADVLHRLDVEPLDRGGIEQLVAQYLNAEQVPARLVDRLQARTEGSPFLIVDFLHSMMDAGAIEPNWGRWRFRDERLDALELSEKSLGFVISRIDRLDGRGRTVLMAAAVLGTRFRLDQLLALTDADPATVNAVITEASSSHIIERHRPGVYEFVHDRIHESLLAEFDADELADTHQRTARWLEENAPRDQTETVYELARHYGAGHPEQTPRAAVRAQLRAGRQAIYDQALEDAYGFLNGAVELAQRADLSIGLQLHQAMGETCARTGRLSRAVEHLSRAAELSDDPLQEARLRILLSQVHQWDSMNTHPMEAQVREAAATLGHRLPRGQLALLVSTLWRVILGALIDWTGWGFGTAQGRERERYALIIELHRQVTHIEYWRLHPVRALLFGFRSLYASHRMGPSVEFVRNYATCSVIAAAGGMGRLARWYARRAVEVGEQLTELEASAYAHLGRLWTEHHLGNQVHSARQQHVHLRRQGRWLSTGDYTMACAEMTVNYYIRGYDADAVEWGERGLEEVRRPGSQGAAIFLLCPTAGAHVRLGHVDTACDYLNRAQEMVADVPDNAFHIGLILGHTVALKYETGDLAAAIEASDAHRRLKLSPARVPYYIRDYYVYQGHVWLRAWRTAHSKSDRLDALIQLERAVGDLKRACGTHLGLRAHWLVLQGALHRARGDGRAARRAWREAESLAVEGDAPWARFELACEHARYLLDRDLAESARTRIEQARRIADEQRWQTRLSRLDEEFGAPLDESSSTSSAPEADFLIVGMSRTAQLESYLQAITQVSLAVSEVLAPREQIRVVLEQLIAILGAERGLLFLTEDDGGLELEHARDAAGAAIEVADTYSNTVVERVATTLEPLVITNSGDGERLYSTSIVTEGIRSIVAAPLLIRDRLVGVVYLDSRLASGIFTAADLAILQALANHIPVALETVRNAQLEAQIASERRRRQLAEALRRLVAQMNATIEIDEIFGHLADALDDFVDVDVIRGITLDQDTCNQVLHRCLDPAPNAGHGPSSKLWELSSSPLLGRAVDRMEVTEVELDPGAHSDDTAHSQRCVSWLGVPLVSRQNVVGALVLESRRPDAFDEATIDLIETFCSQAGIAVENASLMTIDGLTGVYNRRRFFEVAEQELRRASRYDTPLSVIMMDIDHFKGFNDTHGHAAGDRVLRHVADACRESLREVDVLGRYGGEEFAFLLPHTPAAPAGASVAERLRAAIATNRVEWDGAQLRVTASFGVAQYRGGEERLEALIERADQRLYEAKKAGRNRVVGPPDAPDA